MDLIMQLKRKATCMLLGMESVRVNAHKEDRVGKHLSERESGQSVQREQSKEGEECGGHSCEYYWFPFSFFSLSSMHQSIVS